jgi:hypothetical protein
VTRKRKLLVLLVVAGLGLGVAAYGYFTTPVPAPTMENFDRYVRQGMSQRQIEAVLGAPTDDGMDQAGRRFCEWVCEDGRRLSPKLPASAKPGEPTCRPPCAAHFLSYT